ncbi:hypothetical protein DL96DRAFT_1822157 [Flagelloscypha sp. PMI_526]|nr:hypothetical protein DL96DRAFT_1822157 [Flagelloscypha sp. PMI_526]
MALQTDEDLAARVADVDYLNALALVAQSLFYGMFLIIFITSSILLLQQRRIWSTPRKFLFGSILFIGTAMTTKFSLTVAATLMHMSWPHLLVPSATLRAKLAAADKFSKPPQAGQWVVMPLVYIVADAMPVWRAYVMWSHSKLAKTILLVLFGLNVAVCIVQAVYLAVNEFRNTTGDTELRQSIVYAVALLFSVVVNAFSTSLIGYQIWIHRARIKKSSLNSSLPLRMLVLVVEAGLALCVIQIVNASVSIASSFIRHAEPLDALSLSTDILGPFGDSVAASYPSLIVIIMAYRHSVLDTMTQNSLGGGNVTATMQFAEHSSLNEVTFRRTDQKRNFEKNHLVVGSHDNKKVETASRDMVLSRKKEF